MMTPDLPTAISLIGGRYFLFSVDVVSYLRREHRICGVLVGSLPQIPQQNVFLGLPLELMPEEAQLLVDKKIAYLVDDARAHDQGLHNLDRGRRRDYLASLQQVGEKAAKSQAEARAQKTEQAMKKRGLTPKLNDMETEQVIDGDGILPLKSLTKVPLRDEDPPEPKDSDFIPPNPPSKSISNKPAQSSALAITPATSHTFLPTLPPGQPPPSGPLQLNPSPASSYPLFAHLHAQNYFLTPGLRFGCQYAVYAGDPLRFHSHFLASGIGWEQEIDLMDIVGGGRLGTGVKKAYLIGGQEVPLTGTPQEGHVRTFSVEWAVM